MENDLKLQREKDIELAKIKERELQIKLEKEIEKQRELDRLREKEKRREKRKIDDLEKEKERLKDELEKKGNTLQPSIIKPQFVKSSLDILEVDQSKNYGYSFIPIQKPMGTEEEIEMPKETHSKE